MNALNKLYLHVDKNEKGWKFTKILTTGSLWMVIFGGLNFFLSLSFKSCKLDTISIREIAPLKNMEVWCCSFFLFS